MTSAHSRGRAAIGLVVALVIVIGAIAVGYVASSSGSSRARSSTPPTTRVAAATPRSAAAAGGAVQARRARVLLIGDSILDQEGSAAAFLLRQANVDAKAVGIWGSGLLSVDQYDFGRTNRSGGWLRTARNEIAVMRPDVVGVYLNHSYWPPYPHDANGRVITDLWSASGQQMISQQARALITILRARGAKVFFIAPVPAGTIGNPDPDAWSPIWHGYEPVLRAMHVRVADPSAPLENAAGLRAETHASCDGSQVRVRPPDDVHLTRFGAGLAGTQLAAFVARMVHADLLENAAPADDAAALVPTPDDKGYWLVGCDGSVYHFGDAAHLAGARAVIASHGRVVAGVATRSGAGLWLVTADGTIAGIGDARPLTFTSRPLGSIVAAAAIGGEGIRAVDGAGVVYRTAGAPDVGSGPAPGAGGAPATVAIATTRDGRGYWTVARDGRVSAFGDARELGRAPTPGDGAVVGMTPTPDDGGYWLVRGDGRVLAFGDARLLGDGSWQRPPGRAGADMAVPGPTIGIVEARGAGQGYWLYGSTGRVVARGAARGFGGDNNLALATQ